MLIDFLDIIMDKVDLARKILIKTGEDVSAHLKEIALHTCRRSIRNRVLQALGHHAKVHNLLLKSRCNNHF